MRLFVLQVYLGNVCKTTAVKLLTIKTRITEKLTVNKTLPVHFTLYFTVRTAVQ